MKKFPSFIRLARNRRFDFEPRHYDPVKEDIENRVAIIKSEMEESENSGYVPNLTGAFKRNRKTTMATAPGFLQLIIFIILLGGFIGWVFYGNVVFYILSAFIPVYLFLRLRKVF